MCLFLITKFSLVKLMHLWSTFQLIKKSPIYIPLSFTHALCLWLLYYDGYSMSPNAFVVEKVNKKKTNWTEKFFPFFANKNEIERTI